MSRAKMAPTEEVVLSISRPKIMIVDDDAELLEGARDFLSLCDIDVETAQRPEEVKDILESNKANGEQEFDVLATDIYFGELSEIKGDDFIRESKDLIGNAKTVLFSGEITSEERRNLEDDGYPVLVKSRNFNQELVSIIKEENRKKTVVVEEVLKNETAPRIKELTGREVKIELTGLAPSSLNGVAFYGLKEMLINWLKSRGELDEQIFAYGNYVYSANELISEVENETEIGREHVQMMLNEFQSSLEIDEYGSPQPVEGNPEQLG